MEPDEPRHGSPLQRLAEAVADGERVDWQEEMSREPGVPRATDSLRAIETISQMCHRFAEEEGRRTDVGEQPATWGEYVLHEKLGEGSFSDVYRATDPLLQRQVALKLFKPGARPSGREMESFLDEARRLARVRHPNIVVVHGADVHAGRAGLCTELLHGDTLEELLASRGCFGAHEAALVGIELCAALAALHAAGFVHGDVKASNVMRAEGGRIVLMDFGSAAEAPSSSGTPPARTGTPLVLAPEVLHGAAASKAADVYQLGALLYRLVTGSYPVPAQGLDELTQKVERKQWRRLRDLRADLPAAFVQVVERALSPEASQRFASMGDMEEALRLGLGAGKGERRQRRSLRGFAAVAGVLLLLAAGLVGARRSRLLEGPVQVQAAMYRLQDGRPRPLEPQTGVKAGDALFMTLESHDDLHVYVVNEATAEPGVLNTLFPDPGLTLQNPLRGGVMHRLPSETDGEAFWQATAAGGVEKILVVASRGAYDAMEAVVARSAEVAGSTNPQLDPTRLEALDLRAIELRKQAPASSSRIDRLAQVLEAERRRGKDIWFEVIRLESAPPPPQEP